MRPVSVVVVEVIDDEVLELTAVPDDGAVEEFTTQRSDPAFSERIRDWGSDREGAGNSSVCSGQGFREKRLRRQRALTGCEYQIH